MTGFKNLIIVFLLLLPAVSFPKIVDLVRITRSDSDEIVYFTLKLNNEDQLQKLRIKSESQDLKLSKSDFNKGTVIYTQRGIDIVKLQSDDLDISLGGYINFKYLSKYNIFTASKYKTIIIQILKDEAGD